VKIIARNQKILGEVESIDFGKMKMHDKVALGLMGASFLSLGVATFADNEKKEVSAAKWFFILLAASIGYKIITNKLKEG